MRSAISLLAMAVCVSLVAAQEAPPYRSSENPYQEDLAFVAGQTVVMRVDVQGVQLDAVTVTPQVEPRSGEPTRCSVLLTGTNQATEKVTVTTVLLLEDADGRGLERIQLDAFKVKSGRQLSQASDVNISGTALLSSKRVYVYIELAF